MNRRTFVGQLSAGLALQAVPASLIAGASSFFSPNPPSPSWLDKASEIIRSGALGTPQRLTISRVYSPELTPQPALLAMARQDFDLAGRLLRTNLAIDPNTIFMDSPSSLFGSYSTCLYRAGMALTWQGLARIGRRASGSNGILRIFGSEGVLQIATDGLGYQLVDFREQLVWAENRASA